MLAFVAIFLIKINRVYLISRSVEPEIEAKIREVFERHPAVSSVSALTGVVLTMGQYRVAADLDFDGAAVARRLLSTKDIAAIRATLDSDEAMTAWLEGFAEELLQALGAEVDEIEAEVRAAVPGVAQVDLEADA